MPNTPFKFQGAGAKGRPSLGTDSAAGTSGQGQKLRHEAARWQEVGTCVPPRGPGHHVGPAHGQNLPDSVPGHGPPRVRECLLTPGGQKQPHQLFQLWQRMDPKLYPCFFTQHCPLACSITPAPTQPLPHGSAHGNASEIIQPSTTQRKYLASLTDGYTNTQSELNPKPLDKQTTLSQPHHSLKSPRCRGRLVVCKHFQHKVS